MLLFKSLVVALLVSACAVPVFAEEYSDPGSGNRGLTLGVGYDLSHLDFEETVDNFTLDKDTGWLSGVNVEARYETRAFWTRFTYDYSLTDDAKYDGHLQDGTPIQMGTKEVITRYEGNIGYKLFNVSTATLTPYLGIGFREWKRGENALPDFLENYTWWFGDVGLNYVWWLKRWTVGADVAVLLPFHMRVKTNTAGLTDEATFKIKSKVGFKAELPITFDLYRAEGGSHSFFAFLTPYYQHWAIKASDPVMLTSGGVPIGFAFEPDSTTDIFGANIGVGINF